MKTREDVFVELDPKGLSIKHVKAPLWGSTRLTLFVMLLICTTNFILQRFTINFGLVCMHRPIPRPIFFESADQAEVQLGTLHNGSILVSNITNNENEALLESSSLVLHNDLADSPGASSNSAKNNDSDNHSWIKSEPIDFDLEGISSSGTGVKCGEGSNKGRKPGNITGAGSFTTEFSWSKDTQAGIIAAFYYGLAFSQIPCGWFVDRFGAKTAILLSHFFLSVLGLLNPLAAKLGPEYMFVARLLQGVVNGAAMPALNVLATRWSPEMERSFLLGIGYAGFGLAAAIDPITAFFCENTGWEWSFYFYGGTGLLWSIAAYFLIFEWPENHPRIKMEELNYIQTHSAVQYGNNKERIKPPYKAMLLSVPVWAFIVTNFCMFWCFLTVSAYLPTYLTEVLDLDISENGVLSAMPYIGMMSVHFIAAIMFDWLRGKKLCSVTVLRKSFNIIGMLGSAISIGALGLVPCDNIAVAVMLLTFCQSFLELPLMGGYLYSIFDMAPRYASSLTSIGNTFGLLTGFISPSVVAYMTSDGTREQWIHVFYLSAGLMVFGALVYQCFGKCTLQPWATKGGTGSTVADGSGSIGRSNSKKIEQEMKQLKIRLINGESDVKGQRVKS